MVDLYVGVYSLIYGRWLTSADGATVSITGPGYPSISYFYTDQNGVAGPIPINANTTYHLGAEANGHATQSKDFTTGNTVRTDFYLTSAGVDIRCESISVNPGNIRQGDAFDIIVSYKNYGTSGTQQKNIYSDTTIIKTDYINLNAGATTTATYHFSSGACPQLCEGTHTIKCDAQTATLTIGSMTLNIYIDIQAIENTPGAWPIQGATVIIAGISKITGTDGMAGTWTLTTGTDYTFTVTASGYNNYSRSFRYDQQISATLLAEMTPSAPTDPCLGYNCSDICVNNNRYSQTCQNIGGVATCIQGPLVETNSYYCRSTNYAEFDVSFIPQLMIDYLLEDIVHISDTIMTYLPLFDNVQYVGSTFSNGKFRMYVNYTPMLSASITSDDPIKILEIHKQAREMNSLALISIESFFAFVSGVIIFLICVYFGTRVTMVLPIPYIGIVTAAIVAGIALVAIRYVIYDILLGSSGSTTKTVDPAAQIDLVKTYTNDYGIKACNDLYPTCATTPSTCSTTDMAGYNKCVGSWRLAQEAHADTTSGTYSQTIYDTTKNRIEEKSDCVAAGTCTPEDVKNFLNDLGNEANTNSDAKKELVTCAEGQLYDVNLKKCVTDCSFVNPLTGTCIVTKSTLDTLVMGAGILIGAYILLRFWPKKS